MIKKIGAMVLAAVSLIGATAFAAGAADDPLAELLKQRDAAGTPIRLGVWHAGLAECRAYAEKNGYPLVAVWSNKGCAHCEKFEQNCISDPFREWMANSGYVFCFVYSGDSDGKINNAAYNWCWGERKSLKAYPFVRFYWVENGTKRVDQVRTGDQVDNSLGIQLGSKTNPDYGTYNRGGRYMVDFVSSMFPGYIYDPAPPYVGGYFSFTNNTAQARLEAAATTTTLRLKLFRTATTAATQTLRTTYPDNTTATTSVVWAANVTNQTVAVSLDGTKYSAGKTVKLELLNADDDDATESATTVTYSTPANSALNPYWIGEKTASTLAAGEWTMDLDVAKARTKAQSGDAYTLVMLTGTMWCPWCVGIEDYVLSSTEFKKWAQDNNVSLVTLDFPKRSPNDDLTSTVKSVSTVANGAAPTLLREDIGLFNSSVKKSGAGYLSRKMITSAAAEAKLLANHTLDYIGGALCDPDNYRVGFPTLIVMDKNGNIAGRLNTQRSAEKDSSGRYVFDKAENIARLTQLLENADAGITEASNFARTTGLTLAIGGSKDVELKAADNKKVLKLTGVPSSRATFTASESSATLQVLKLSSVKVQRKDASGTVKSTETVQMPEVLATGTNTVAYTFTAGTTYYLRVSDYTDKTKKFGSANEKTVTVSSAIVLTPSENLSTYTPNGTTVGMDIVKDTAYKFSGIAASALAADFTAKNDGTHVAKATKTVTLAVTAGSPLTYQIWKPGTIAFDNATLAVYETIGAATFKVTRTGGSSGAANVTVSVKSEDSAASGRWTFAEQKLTWADGEEDVKVLTFTAANNKKAESDGTVVLAIAATQGKECAAKVSSGTLRVTIADSDVPTTEKTTYSPSLYNGFNGSYSIPVENVNGTPTISVTSGSLPRGVKVAWDASERAVVISGKPVAEGASTFAFTVSDVRNGTAVKSAAVTVNLTVAAASKINSYVGTVVQGTIPVCGTRSGKSYVAGLLTVKTTKRNAVSVKFAGTESGTALFRGSWTDLDSETGTVSLTVVNTRKGQTLELALDKKGVFTASLRGVATFFGSALDGSAPAQKSGTYSAFAGTYTVTLPVSGTDKRISPTGTGVLTLTMTSASQVKKGTMRFSGTFPNGVSASGTAQLAIDPDNKNQAVLTIFKRSSKDVLGVQLAVCANARSLCKDTTTLQVIGTVEDIQAYHLHRQRPSGYYDYLTELEAYGGYFERNSTPLDIMNDFPDDYASGTFRTVIDASRLSDSSVYGAVASVPSLTLTAAKTGFSVANRNGRMSLRYKRTDGTFSGTGKVVFGNRTVNCRFKGVLLPGWTQCGDCGPVGDLVERPFGSGTIWFTDRVDGKSAVRSMPIDIEYVP